MAAQRATSRADALRRAGEILMDAAELIDEPSRSIAERERLHDAIETAANEARAVVRGPRRPINPPVFLEVDADGRSRAAW